ncbi:MAG: hypothetical protein AAGM38_11600 [Pseudomonadota bacterium]
MKNERIYRTQLTQHETQKLNRELQEFQEANTWVDDNPVAQWRIGQAVADILKRVAPRIVQTLERVRAGEMDAVYIEGLPADLPRAQVLLLGLTHHLGAPFNYASQNGGDLVMKLQPVKGSAENTNSTTAEFKLHTDDAAVPRDARTASICLYGIKNPPGTMTGYAPTLNALAELQTCTAASALIEALYEPRYSVRFPTSFGLDREVWTGPIPIISVATDGSFETRFPSYAIRPVDDRDFVAHAAIAMFSAALQRQVVNVPVNAGCFLAFNNLRGAHCRGAIGAGERLVLRTYAVNSLEPLKKATGVAGPIFPVEPFARAARAVRTK